MMVGNAMTVTGVTMKRLRDDIKTQLNLVSLNNLLCNKLNHIAKRNLISLLQDHIIANITLENRECGFIKGTNISKFFYNKMMDP